MTCENCGLKILFENGVWIHDPWDVRDLEPCDDPMPKEDE